MMIKRLLMLLLVSTTVGTAFSDIFEARLSWSARYKNVDYCFRCIEIGKFFLYLQTKNYLANNMKTIVTPNAPAAIGPYSQAIEANGFVYCSGQLPIDPATGTFPSDDIKEQTRQSLRNAQAILREAGLDLGNVVKTTVLLADIADFGAMNEVYAEMFKAPFPARSAFAVRDLPKGARVEIECIAAREK
jgi:2-iminobutanoate/2-iminopropanoate deaminase